MIREVTKMEIREAHDLAHASAVSAGLASLRFVLFDQKSPPCTPGLHHVLSVVAHEFDEASVMLRGFLS